MTLLRVHASEIGLSDDEVNELNDDLKIKFIDEFLFMDDELIKRCKLSQSKLIKAREIFFAGMRAGELMKLSSIDLSATYLTTSNTKLNELLDGGLPMNRVTQLNGDEFSGKTLFCFNLISNLIQDDKRVLYIDTDLAMCSNMFSDLIHEQVDDAHLVSDLMKKIDICFLGDYQELIFKLNELYQTQLADRIHYEVLIIDSIVSLLTVECLISKTSESISLMHERMSLFINLIAKLLTTSITILTTNVPSSHLPKIWSNRCDLILEIRKEETNTEEFFRMITRKSMSDINKSTVHSKDCSPDSLLDDSIDHSLDDSMNTPSSDNLSVDRIFSFTHKGSIR